MNELQELQMQYYELLNMQKFVESDLNYSLLESHRPLLHRLAEVGNSGITVFDLYKKEHVFASYNFGELFGYDMNLVDKVGTDYFDSRVHPEDLIELTRNGILLLKYFYQIPIEERTYYKFVSEYRILGNGEKYIRIIEQHQPLELDKHGNLWLGLAVLDVSPNQNTEQGVKMQVINCKTGQILPLIPENKNPELSKREIEILSLVKRGLLSKEISEKLFISVHTVNTHRQRILEKLNVDNSMEAVGYALRLGLVE
ncbi:MAG: response regulator transcription factor [Bacteroidetes bacterium]|nr:response regulator transcription factor [Bacteroidota bacterium]